MLENIGFFSICDDNNKEEVSKTRDAIQEAKVKSLGVVVPYTGPLIDIGKSIMDLAEQNPFDIRVQQAMAKAAKENSRMKIQIK